MQDINSLIACMEAEYDRKGNIPKLALLVFHINNIFLNIASCSTIIEAQVYFDLLDKIHNLISKIMFVDKLEVPFNCKKFFKDFDRLDASETRRYYFEELKKGNYTLPVGTPLGFLIKIYEDWEGPDDFYIIFRVNLESFLNKNISKIFYFELVSPKRLKQIVNKSNIVIGKGYIIMNDFDINCLEKKIRDIISICKTNAPDGTLNNLSEIFKLQPEKVERLL